MAAVPPVSAAAAERRKQRSAFQQMPNPATPAAKPDPFYGHEAIARLCARFITHLFACPEYPPNMTHMQAKLPYFIAYALHRTKLHPAVTFASLVLLQRLKARFPSARGSSGHRLFVSAFMIASKVICDDTYSNKSWSIVAQGMFSLREINQMEREMCNYLDWELTVDNPILSNFEKMVTRDFAVDTDAPHPIYALQQVSRRAARAAASTSATPIPEPTISTSPIPAFSGQQRNPSSPTKPDNASPTRTSSSYPSSPMPETPSPSYSPSSPTSSASPTTPISEAELQHHMPEKYHQKLAQMEPPVSSMPLTTAEVTWTSKRPLVMTQRANTTLKSRMYAFAVPVRW